ncbi:hypothetical protein AC579_7005 [Pseudocercospora musae]|uniref:Xylanolytic transcriptional activator regulatory domain-containing protein n=1 Tax=Pseudocercospora musae TaxID=113226 RepID=A0A139GTA3_9PEZI|nr:hypothetical protein AC579_7005 [Pseudocercospora musae]
MGISYTGQSTTFGCKLWTKFWTMPRQISLIMQSQRRYGTILGGLPHQPRVQLPRSGRCSGENLRWEVVGLLLVHTGAELSDMPGWHSIFSRLPRGLHTRAQVMQKMLQLGNACTAFSKECGPRNELVACLMYVCMLMTERAVGDSSSEAWHNMGLVCDTVITMGLHQQKKVDTDTPFFLRELRKWLFILAYNHDKFLAEFLGRPSRISYRHCSIQELLPLGDQEICGSERTPAGVSANEPGHPTRSTWRKAFYSLTKIGEDLLELTLGEKAD